MELSNEFTVGMPPDRAFEVLTDVERIAPCLPGAELQEVKGDEYLGVVKVKVGPITAQYKGVAKFLEKDPVARRAVLRAEGRDTRGQGNASATVTASLEPAGTGTKVRVVTDLTITGKVAQFGRGVLADVSNKLIGQFVQSLEATVADAPAAAASAGAPGAGSSGRRGGRGSSAASSGAEPAATGTGRAATGANGTTSSGAEANGAGHSGAASPGSREPSPGAGAASAAGAGEQGSSQPATTTADRPGSAAAATAAATTPPPRPAAEPVDLLELAGGSIVKRAAPVVGVAVILALLIWLWSRRRGSSPD